MQLPPPMFGLGQLGRPPSPVAGTHPIFKAAFFCGSLRQSLGTLRSLPGDLLGNEWMAPGQTPAGPDRKRRGRRQPPQLPSLTHPRPGAGGAPRALSSLALVVPPPRTSPPGRCCVAIAPSPPATGSRGSGSARSWSSRKTSLHRRPKAPQLGDLALQRPRVLIFAAVPAPQPPPTPAVTSCDGLLPPTKLSSPTVPAMACGWA